MNPIDRPIPSTLAEMQGAAPYDHEEIAELRRRAWTEHGLLIVSPSDRRLSETSRHLLFEIGESIYGAGGQS